MTEHDGDDLSPTLAETARRRADLHGALIELERALARPAIGREPEWTKGVVLRLEELHRMIEEHVEVTERPDGLYDEISAKAPHLTTKMHRLRDEHPALLQGTAELLSRLRTQGISEGWPLNEARADLQRLLGKIVRHRQLGSDLVWEAYNLDIGGIE